MIPHKKRNHVEVVTMFEDTANQDSLYRVSIGVEVYEIADVDAWGAERAARARYRREHTLPNGAQTPEASATMIAAVAPKSPIKPHKTKFVKFVQTFLADGKMHVYIARDDLSKTHVFVGRSAERLYWLFKYGRDWKIEPGIDGGFFAWPKKEIIK